MAGHNKWKQIKHKKAVEDAKKSREFSKCARHITLESKKTLGDARSPGLRSAVEHARAINMPNANIERAIKRGLEKNSLTLEEVVYEGYGPGGSALVVYGLTDNKNRTSQEIKHLLSERGGTFSGVGTASWMFTRKGNVWAPLETLELEPDDKEKLETLVQALEEHEDVQKVYSNASE